MWAPRKHADVLNIKSAKHFLIDEFIQGLDATRGGHGVARRYFFILKPQRIGLRFACRLAFSVAAHIFYRG